ncbi:hypothetical protein LCGC14_2539000 [marine sediment metagenome]|uniref:YprB ribonuclease H-like domain-containing protein n=1 Tax=marine sediment metagenome TaxID=412755 RepID=A0A0F9ARB0_9ZZZZ
MLKQKKIHCELEEIPSMEKRIATALRNQGINSGEQLLELSLDDPLFKKFYPLRLIANYAKAIIYNKIVTIEDIISPFDTIKEKEEIYFFDTEHDSTLAKTGPYGVFLIGWMSMDGERNYLFLENPEDELELLKKFSDWVKRENPILIAYSSDTAEVKALGASFSRHKLPFSHIRESMFDIYSNVIFTQSVKRQKYFLPIKKLGSNPLGLKKVSECLGYQPSTLEISHGMNAPRVYERYLREGHKKVYIAQMHLMDKLP